MNQATGGPNCDNPAEEISQKKSNLWDDWFLRGGLGAQKSVVKLDNFPQVGMNIKKPKPPSSFVVGTKLLSTK